LSGMPWRDTSSRADTPSAARPVGDVATERNSSHAPVWQRGQAVATVEIASRPRNDIGRWTVASAAVAPPAVSAAAPSASAGSASGAQGAWSRRAEKSNAPPVVAARRTEEPKSGVTWSPGRPAPSTAVAELRTSGTPQQDPSTRWSRSASAPSAVIARAPSAPQWTQVAVAPAPVQSDVQDGTSRSTRITWISPDRPDPAPAVPSATAAEASPAENGSHDVVAALPPQQSKARPEPEVAETRAGAWSDPGKASPPAATIVTASLARPATANWHRAREAAPVVAGSPAAARSQAAAPAEARSPLAAAMADARSRRAAEETSSPSTTARQGPEQVAALAVGTAGPQSGTQAVSRAEPTLPEPRSDVPSPIAEPLRLGLSVPSDPPTRDASPTPAERTPETPAVSAADAAAPAASPEDGAASGQPPSSSPSSSTRIVWNAPPVQVTGRGSPTGTASSSPRIHWNAPRAEPLPELPAAPPEVVQQSAPTPEPEVREVQVASLPWASGGSDAAKEPPQRSSMATSRALPEAAQPAPPASELASPVSQRADDPPPGAPTAAPSPVVSSAATPPVSRAEAQAPVAPLRVEVARNEDLVAPSRRTDKGPPPRVPPRVAPLPTAADTGSGRMGEGGNASGGQVIAA